MNFYPRPPRGGRPASDLGPWPPDPISIHALREEGDTYFYSTSTRNVKFLSTPSARRATVLIRCITGVVGISIHALREEGDLEAARNGPCLENFYPRPPRGGRPFRFALLYDDITISIHALREEGDARDLAGDNTNTISIHALREEGDPFVTGRSTVLMLFLSTPSARRATGR